MPTHVKATEDMSKYYIKSPQEMSRYELAELEQELREVEDPSADSGFELADGEEVPEWVKELPEFKEA